MTVLRRALAPITSTGWSVLAATVALWVLAVRLGWVEFGYLAAAGLVILVLAGVMALGRTALRVSVAVEPSRVVVGTSAAGRVEVRNLGRRLLPLALEVPIGTGLARFRITALAHGAMQEELFVVGTSRRGVIPIGPATSVRGDPVGLIRRVVRWTELQEVIVHPVTVPLEPFGVGLLTDLEGLVTADVSMSDLAFNALREYRPGDDRRHVHWRSSAKAGQLLVRQYLDTRRAHITVIVDSQTSAYIDPEQFETAVSAGASLAQRTIADGQSVSVAAGTQVATNQTGIAALDAFSRAELGNASLDYLCERAAATATDTSTAILITGSARDVADIRVAALRFGHDVVTVAMRIAPGQRPEVAAIGATTIVTLPRLQDLSALVQGVLGR